VLGGELKSTTIRENCYGTTNICFMLDWVHGRLDKTTVVEAHIRAHGGVFAIRTQVAI
jgi:hypothetical protein